MRCCERVVELNEKVFGASMWWGTLKAEAAAADVDTCLSLHRRITADQIVGAGASSCSHGHV